MHGPLEMECYEKGKTTYAEKLNDDLILTYNHNKVRLNMFVFKNKNLTN